MTDSKAAFAILLNEFEAWAIGPNGGFLKEELKHAAPCYQYTYERESLNNALDGWRGHAALLAERATALAGELTPEQHRTIACVDAWLRTLGLSTYSDLCAAVSPATADSLPTWFETFLRNVCEIPDRNSPEGEPEAIVATLDELKSCALNAIEACAAPQPATADERAAPAPVRRPGNLKPHEIAFYADMFFDVDDRAGQYKSIAHALKLALQENENFGVGSEFTIGCAARLPDITVRVTYACGHADVRYEVVDERACPFCEVEHEGNSCTEAHRERASHAAAAAAPAEAREPSPTAGMTLAERIKHVGGRENAATYIEFGSVAAVDALIKQVIRDLPRAAPADAGEAVLSPNRIEAIMEQAQVFASAWSSVGGRFDRGDALETAEQEKRNLRAMLAQGAQGGKGGEA